MNKKVFCPHCRNQYLIRSDKGINLIFLFKIVIMAILLFVIFKSFTGFKIIFILFPLLVGVEYAKRVSTRLSIACSYCGFDIITYKKDVKLARAKILEYHQKQKDKVRKLLTLGIE